MNNYLAMMKVQLKSSFNLSAYLSDVKKDKKKLSKLALVIFVLIAFLPSYFLYNALIQVTFEGLSQVNQQGAILALGVTAASVIILFFGFMYVFSAFYGSKDLDMLLAMPLKPKTIIASKLTGIIFYEYLFAIPILAPIFINFGINVEAGVFYWIYALILTLVVPIVPLSIGAILVISVIRLFGMRVNVEHVQMGFMFFFVFVMLGVNFLTTRSVSSLQSGTEQDMLLNMIKDNSYLIDTITRIFPPAKLASEALLNYRSVTGVLYLIGNLLTHAAAMFLAVFVGDKIYMAGVTKGLGGKRSSRKKDQTVDYSTSSKAISVFKKDMLILIRTPIFAFNTLFIIPLLPIIMFMGVFSGGEGGLAPIVELYQNFSSQVLVLGSVALIFFSGLTTITSSTFSREGNAFWINQIAPISPKDQLIGRCLSAVLVVFALVITFVAVAGIVVHMNLIFMLLMIIVSTIGAMPLIVISLIIDLVHPKLDWTDPAKAVKQNMNVVFSMLLGMVLAAVYGGISLLLYSLHVYPIAILLVIALISLALTALFAKMFLKMMPKKIQFR